MATTSKWTRGRQSRPHPRPWRSWPGACARPSLGMYLTPRHILNLVPTYVTGENPTPEPDLPVENRSSCIMIGGAHPIPDLQDSLRECCLVITYIYTRHPTPDIRNSYPTSCSKMYYGTHFGVSLAYMNKALVSSPHRGCCCPLYE